MMFSEAEGKENKRSRQSENYHAMIFSEAEEEESRGGQADKELTCHDIFGSGRKRKQKEQVKRKSSNLIAYVFPISL